MLVEEIMTQSFVKSKDSIKIREAAKVMEEKKSCSMFLVDERDRLVGSLTEDDFIGSYEDVPKGFSMPSIFGELLDEAPVEEIFARCKEKPVREVMKRLPATITPKASVTYAVKTMLKKNIGEIPVVDQGQLVGLVSRKDVVKAMVRC